MSIFPTRKDSRQANLRFKDQNLLRNSFPKFEQIRRNGKLCDVTLIAESQKFSAHKIVLAATIPYFDAMFLSNMSEASKREIFIHDVDPSTLESFIIFAYTGEIQITPNNVQSVLIGASFLQIDSVRRFCCQYIEERLTLENLVSVRGFASSLLCSNLVAACDRLIHVNFEALAESPILHSLTGPEFIKLLESDDLQVTSEERVFHSVISWCEYEEASPRYSLCERQKSVKSSFSLQSLSDGEHELSAFDKYNDGLMSMSTCASWLHFSPVQTQDERAQGCKNSRLKFLPFLLSCVRLPLLPAQFIRDVVSKNEYIRSDIRCRDLLDEARDLLLLPDSTTSRPCSFSCRPRRGQHIPGIIYAVGGITAGGDCQSIVESYHPLLDRWEVVESMSTQRSRIAVVVLNGYLYAIGGLDGTSRLNTVERFDPKTGVWEKVASMNYRRSALGAAVLNDKIYVCGGYDGIASLRTCEVYNPEQNRWQVIPSMTECRSASGVVALEDGRLFALGGHNGLPIFASVECYHRRGHNQRHPTSLNQPTLGSAQTGTTVWRHVAPMLNKRCRHGVAVLHGRIFAAGGYNGSIFLRSVEMFDPNAGSSEPDGLLGQWTEMSPMNTPRSRVSLAATFGRLFAIGGFDGEKNLNTVECFQRTEKKLLCDYESSSGSRSTLTRCRSRDNLEEEEAFEEEPHKPICSAASFSDKDDTSNLAALFTGEDSFLPDLLTEDYDAHENMAMSSRAIQTPPSPALTGPSNLFSDWRWLPAVPLIAHEGGVGVGVIPIY